jgi:acyl transferase domain-containing protein/NADPH:quinone reductase-like Zn-dependent oxidoreductase/thioesterase domain-containing protein/acyl carrier protein/short-subunit dehydrogenase
MYINEPIAIVGIGCRFPGDANSPRAFWEMICAGTDAIGEIPTDRWNIAAHFHPTAGPAGKSVSRFGGFLKGINGFDSSFFRIPAREADAMDPQQRLLLEATWEALEDAGQRREELEGSKTGVFVGISTSDYATMQYDAGASSPPDVYSAPGCTFSIAANRISYCLDLRGPSMAIDTACSSAMSACHAACQSLWRGECGMAVVAGVNALLNHNSFVVFSRMSMLSPDGRCKSFDAEANGYVRAEGVGAVFLKPLSLAREANDRIYAVIRAICANQDGHTNGITVPSEQAQEALIRHTCRSAGILPGAIAYVEAHGTGTAVGDPIEAAALGAALAEGRTSPCVIGSVKTNIGHTESASGVASLIKVALMLRNQQIPPNLHFHTPNPQIDFAALNLRVADRLEKLPNHGSPQLAGINSFGFGGANVHAILEAGPAEVPRPKKLRKVIKPLLLPLSAHSAQALRQAAANYAVLIESGECDARSVCAAAATRRTGLDYRLCVQASSRQELAARLRQFAAGQEQTSIVSGEIVDHARPVFVFSGQGTQWWRMGRELMRCAPRFRAKIQECDAIFRSLGSWSLVEELERGEEDSRLRLTAIAQPAIFTIQVALAELWSSWGVLPSAVVGHSVGEVAAAFVAGALPFEEAARIIFHRGRAMDASRGCGRMLAASITAAQAEELIADYGGAVEIGAINSPRSVTLSGDPEPLAEIASCLDERGIFNCQLRVNYAFHSRQMDDAKDDLMRSVGRVRVQQPHVPLYSTVTGTAFTAGDFDADYWWRNVRRTVRFSDAVAGLIARGHKLFLELSAHPALTGSIKETLDCSSAPGAAFSSLRRGEPEMETMLATLGSLYVAGAKIDWARIYPGSFAQVDLPIYPWQHEAHWRETRASQVSRLEAPSHFFLDRRLDSAQPSWRVPLDTGTHKWLREHRVQGHILLPGASLIEMACEAGADLFPSLPIELEDFELREALVLPDGRDQVELRVDFSPADSVIRICSRREATSSDWTLHAVGRIRPARGATAKTIKIDKVINSLDSRFDREEIYQVCRSMGFDYGPGFRGLERLWRSDRAAVGKLEWPETLSTECDGMLFHPAMLDCCLQTTMFAGPQSGAIGTFVPVFVERITAMAPPQAMAFCHTRQVACNLNSAIWNMEICAADGSVLCLIEGYRAQALRRSTAARAIDPAHWFYEDHWIEKPIADGEQGPATDGRWLIFADRSGVGNELAGQLLRSGATVELLEARKFLKRATGLDPSLSDQIHSSMGNGLRELAGIIHLWSLDVPARADGNARHLQQAEEVICHSLLAMIQAMSRSQCTAPVWIATCGAQPGGLSARLSVAQSLAIGMGRSMMSEFPRMSFRMVDLDPAVSHGAVRCLISEILHSDGETESAWRGGIRRVSRIANRSLESLTARPRPGRSVGHVFHIAASGVVDDMEWFEQPRCKPRAGEIEVQVESAALNFRDVLKALNLYPIESNHDFLLGDECCGRVVGVGEGVKQFKVGDPVFASAAGCFSSHITIPAVRAIRRPAGISPEQAASIPVAFLTAWYALHEVGRIRRGETILIHSAAGGVGLAAMQIARLAGAQILATAGSEQKRDYLRRKGAAHVFDSRTTAFAAGVRRATKGRGVDVILNSLAGDAISKSLSLLAPGGRFLEIGKRDVYANTAVGLRPLRNNACLHVIDMGQVLVNAPGRVHQHLRQIVDLFRSKNLHPLPLTVFPFSRAGEAFREMAQGRHIGKIVLSAGDEQIVARRRLPWENLRFSSRVSYLITGGMSGFGLELARWMASRGGRDLVLVGRRGAYTPEARAAVAELRGLGVRVTAIRADVSDPRHVDRLLRRIASSGVPLRGVFHAAMVLDDGMLIQFAPERYRTVLAAKALGAWNLHQATLHHRLDYFVLFSSVASLLGSAGQSNYICANCVLDALAHHRKAMGLPALAVNWGPIRDAGYLARNPAIAEYLADRGLRGMASSQALEMLGRMMQSDAVQMGFAEIDWKKIAGLSKGGSPVPRYSDLAGMAGRMEPGVSGSLRAELESASSAGQLDLAVEQITGIIAKIMRTAASRLDPVRPLSELGLDSLMAFEVAMRLEDAFAITLSTNTISHKSTIRDLAVMILRACGLNAPCIAAPQLPAKAPCASDQAVVLRNGPAHGALFFIHPADGGTELYAELARALPAGIKVFGIGSKTATGHSHQWNSLTDMARSYARLVESLAPTCSIRIAGFSAGALFALAVARELERAGRTVAFVGMIEAPFVALDAGHKPEQILQELVFEIVRTLVGDRLVNENNLNAKLLGLARSLVKATDEDKQLQVISEWLAGYGIDLRDVEKTSVGVVESLRRFIRHASLLDKAKIEHVDAPVWSWQADTPFLGSKKGSKLDGRRITRGSIHHARVPGRHFEVMSRPAVGELARSFASALADADRSPAASPQKKEVLN